MGKGICIFLLSLVCVCMVHSTHAAYPGRAIHKTADSAVAEPVAEQPTGTTFTTGKDLQADTVHKADRNNTLPARHTNVKYSTKAFVWALIGILLSPLGIVAIHFGAKGLRKGQQRKGLAIAGLIIGILDVLYFAFLLIIVLG